MSADAVDIWKARRLEAESLLEQAQELEKAAEAHDLPLEEVTIHFTHANNLRLRALCLLDPVTRAVEPETEEDQ